MTKDLKHTLALVALNGRAMDLYRDFQDSGDAESAALMRQIGEQVTIALGLMLKRRAAAEAQGARGVES